MFESDLFHLVGKSIESIEFLSIGEPFRYEGKKAIIQKKMNNIKLQ